MKIRQFGALDDELIATAEIDRDFAARFVRCIEQRLKRRKTEVAHIDSVASIQVRNNVDSSALADEKNIIAPTAV